MNPYETNTAYKLSRIIWPELGRSGYRDKRTGRLLHGCHSGANLLLIRKHLQGCAKKILDALMVLRVHQSAINRSKK